MYQKSRYAKQDPEYIFDFIVNHPFATCVLQGKRLLGTHIPVLPEGNARDFRLFSHISNQYNEQINFLEDGREILLIFHGPQAYISSSWYKEKNISTWDYSAVHINARIKKQSPAELADSLRKLVRHFEEKQDNPLYYEDIPERMIESQLPHITGFWSEPFNIEAVAKLHQGYKKEDVKSVTENLEKMPDPTARDLSRLIRKEHDSDS